VYSHVSRVNGNPGNDASPLQLPSVHHNPFCDGACTWCTEENRIWIWGLVEKT